MNKLPIATTLLLILTVGNSLLIL